MIELSAQAIFLQDSHGCAVPFAPDDLAARIRSVLPENGADPDPDALARDAVSAVEYALRHAGKPKSGPLYVKASAVDAMIANILQSVGFHDAAAAYGRALATGARTSSGAHAALELGRIETSNGLFDAAKAHLSDAVERTASRDELRSVCTQAYVALAKNEEERGDASAALGYHMLVGTLFNDPEFVPHALESASAIMRKQGRGKEADALDAERARRFPADKPEK